MIKCPNQAIYRFTWPGRDESFICEEHVSKLESIASALGFYLQVIPLVEGDGQHTCNQEVEEKDRNRK